MRLLILTATLLASLIGAFAYHTHRTRELRSELIQEFTGDVVKQTFGCSKDARLDAAMINYKVGCLLATIRICSSQSEPTKFVCYKRGQAECEQFSINFRAWLGRGK